MTKFALSVLFTLTAGAALAHSGHGAEPTTHWLPQPSHLAVVVLFVAAVAPAVVRISRRRERAHA